MTLTPHEMIAKGGTPVWEETFPHPEYGDLTFTARLPKASDWLRLAVVQAEIAPGIPDSLLAESIAGLQTIVDLPVLDEERIEDPDDPQHITIKRVLYDPLEDVRMEFPVAVWTVFRIWRENLLSEDGKEQVKNSSGATTGSSSGEPSPAPTDSPPSTH